MGYEDEDLMRPANRPEQIVFGIFIFLAGIPTVVLASWIAIKALHVGRFFHPGILAIFIFLSLLGSLLLIIGLQLITGKIKTRSSGVSPFILYVLGVFFSIGAAMIIYLLSMENGEYDYPYRIWATLGTSLALAIGCFSLARQRRRKAAKQV